MSTDSTPKLTMVEHTTDPGPQAYCNDCEWSSIRGLVAAARKHARENRGHTSVVERVKQQRFQLLDWAEIT